MAKTQTRARNHPQAPRTVRPPATKRPVGAYLAVAAAIVAISVGYLVLGRSGSSTGNPEAVGGLPNASDYHSLLVSPSDPRQLILGTHQGLYRSTDGGRHWSASALPGRDAMNLVRIGAGTIWLAGHDVFAKSTDGGLSWQELRPSTLPSLDLHGFAVDPRNPRILYAAVAGVGLFRSTDAGRTFAPVSRDVGGGVMALALTRAGQVLAVDMQRGLLVSPDGGRTWRATLNAQLAGLAINPSDAQLVLATGPGILRSTDGGKHWSQAFRLDAGAGPVAWSPAHPNVAYVVGFDRTLYRSGDSGATWAPVG